MEDVIICSLDRQVSLWFVQRPELRLQSDGIKFIRTFLGMHTFVLVPGECLRCSFTLWSTRTTIISSWPLRLSRDWGLTRSSLWFSEGQVVGLVCKLQIHSLFHNLCFAEWRTSTCAGHLLSVRNLREHGQTTGQCWLQSPALGESNLYCRW